MAGELWRGYTQAAVETAYGTAVQPATRRMYYEDPHFGLTRDVRTYKFATGTRDNARARSLGPQVIDGTLKLPLSASEIIELLLMNLNGATAPTQPAVGTDPTVYLWTFTPSSAATPLKSGTFEWHDGARAWLVSGVLCDKIQIAGSANGLNEITATMFGKAIAATTMTASLAERTPDVIEGWQTKLYIDSFLGTPGTTQVTGTLINWDVQLMANLQRKYFAANTNSLGAVAVGELGVEATLTFEASNAAALTAFGDFNVAVATPTYKLVRLDFDEDAIISHAYTKLVSIDLPGSWTALDLGQNDNGTRTYQLKYQYIYDPTNLFGVQVRCQNTRAAGWV
jgi:Phage tail tube protein